MEQERRVRDPGHRRLGRRATDLFADETAVRGQVARAPRPVAPSAWILPDPSQADEDGVVGVGADLAPSTLVDAYRRGIFPWPHPGVPLPWFSPDPRGVLWPDAVAVSRSLTRRLRGSGWVTTVDEAFEEVVRGCAEGRGEAGTWISPPMLRAYVRLHELGWAHSLEVWDGDELVGGIYGVQVGAVFTGESMFHRATDASKVALVDLASRLLEAGGSLLDVQVTTGHLRSMGALDLSRDAFLDHLAAAREQPVRLVTNPRPVAGLVACGGGTPRR